MKRQFDPAEPELMDRPQPVTPELDVDLRNLRQLNRHFGSYALISHFLDRWLKPRENYRIADLATGSGDIPRLVADYARRIGAAVSIDAVDQQGSTLEIAKGLSSGYPEIDWHHADVLSFSDEAEYDIVLCSLALHHFPDEAAVLLAAQAKRLSRRSVLIADLRRGFFASAGVYLLTAIIYREAMTRIDGRLSAARAFSFEEMSEIAEKAGWKNFGHERFRFARQAIWIDDVAA